MGCHFHRSSMLWDTLWRFWLPSSVRSSPFYTSGLRLGVKPTQWAERKPRKDFSFMKPSDFSSLVYYWYITGTILYIIYYILLYIVPSIPELEVKSICGYFDHAFRWRFPRVNQSRHRILAVNPPFFIAWIHHFRWIFLPFSPVFPCFSWWNPWISGSFLLGTTRPCAWWPAPCPARCARWSCSTLPREARCRQVPGCDAVFLLKHG